MVDQGIDERVPIQDILIFRADIIQIMHIETGDIAELNFPKAL
jgi:hypothetical protein